MTPTSATTNAPSLSGRFSPTLPHFVGVLGGGRMGAGIAHAFLMAGCAVTVMERDLDALATAHVRVHLAVARSVAKSVEKSREDRAEPVRKDASESAPVQASGPDPTGPKSTSPESGGPDFTVDSVMKRLRLSTDYAHFAPCGLVVEAVPEIQELKATALRAVEENLDPAAFLATNTSSLSVTDLAEGLQRPENFIGLHFFNPVPASLLVEIVTGRQSNDSLVATAQGWVAALGKTAVVVQDSPGFASSRLGVALALEAMRMLEEGVAGAEDIDNAMVLGYRHQTGPLRTTDLVGLDVRLEVAEYLAGTLGERFAPPQILRDMVARGELGRKTGTGFFDWA